MAQILLPLFIVESARSSENSFGAVDKFKNTLRHTRLWLCGPKTKKGTAVQAGLTRKELLEKRGDLSQFLIHLARTGDLKLDKDIYSLPRDQVVQRYFERQGCQP